MRGGYSNPLLPAPSLSRVLVSLFRAPSRAFPLVPRGKDSFDRSIRSFSRLRRRSFFLSFIVDARIDVR